MAKDKCRISAKILRDQITAGRLESRLDWFSLVCRRPHTWAEVDVFQSVFWTRTDIVPGGDREIVNTLVEHVSCCLITAIRRSKSLSSRRLPGLARGLRDLASSDSSILLVDAGELYGVE